jgi:tetratricopeptide (TPR) repeat protein
MADHPRIEDLRRRVQKDPASIAFAQLAEEYRRGGQFSDAVAVCRAGLGTHPGYLSARVTLGRALIELDDLDGAQHELERVLDGAPENLSAIRGLAEIHHRRGALTEALSQYRAALTLARNDPDLEQTVADLAHQIEQSRPSADVEDFAFEGHQASQPETAPSLPDATPGSDFDARSLAALVENQDVKPADAPDLAHDHASRTVAALEEWLAAVHASGANRSA